MRPLGRRRKISSALVLTGVLCSSGLASAMEIRGAPGGRLELGASARDADSRLRAAILSIHAYVEKHRADAPLAEILDHVDPMSPPEATKILRNDDSELGNLRRRRALVRLLSWVRDEPEVRDAVKILVGPARTAEIYGMLTSLDHGGGCDDPDPQDSVNTALNALLGPVSYKKCSNIVSKVATKVPKAGVIGIVARVVAEGSLDRSRSGLDAQRWKECSPLWGKSYLVAVDNTGKVLGNGKCNPNNLKECMPAVGASILPFGESYDTNAQTPFPRPFFENFICDQIPCDVRLMLHIVANRAPTPVPSPTPSSGPGPSPSSSASPNPTPTPPFRAYSLTYSDPTRWKDFPFPNVDYGQVNLYAQDLSNGSGTQALTVASDKTFGFDDWGENAAIFLLLQRIEMSDYLADLVCCQP